MPEIVDGDSDWLWLAMDFDNENAKMLVCTFAVVDKWESGPVPRFLLAKLLERMTGIGSKAPLS